MTSKNLTPGRLEQIRRNHSYGDHYAELGQADIGLLLGEIDLLQGRLQKINDRWPHVTDVERLRAALNRLNDGWKYPTEVVTIASEALSGDSPSAPEQCPSMQMLNAQMYRCVMTGSHEFHDHRPVESSVVETSGWKHISTAPKNGNFLVCLELCPELAWPAHRTDGGSIFSNAHGVLNEKYLGRMTVATHWRPMPPRPGSSEETSAPRFSSMEVDRICNAYESGFGRGTNYDEIAQPYADGCPEAQAYQQGYMLARKRRAQKASTEPVFWTCDNCGETKNRDDYHRISCRSCGKLRPAPNGKGDSHE